MNARETALAAIAAVAALSGCAGPAKEVPEPLDASGRAASSAHYGNLVIGLYPTPAAQAALGSLRAMQEIVAQPPTSAHHQELDPQRIMDDLRAALGARFKEVRIVDSPDAAKRDGLDLVLELGMKVKLAQIAPGSTEFEASAAFTDPERRLLDSAVGVGIGRVGVMGGTHAVRPAWRGALRALLARLDDSTALQAYARAPRRASPPPARPAPVAAAAPPPASPTALPPPLDAPAYRLPEREDRFALIIGIEEYSSLPAAPFAERDASAMRAHARALGVPERNLIFLTGARASRSAIAKYVEEWLPRVVPEGGRVYFYFSGHGAPDPSTGKAYLIPWDGDPAFLASTAYPVSELNRRLDALKAAEVVAVTDACFSGAGGRSVLVAGARPLVGRVEDAFSATGRAVHFSAAAASEITSTLPDKGHGAFTYHFLRGLDGGAKGADGRVTAASLQRYLTPKVRDEARRQNREQTPGLAVPPGRSPDAVILR